MRRALVVTTLAGLALAGLAGCNPPYLTWAQREPLAARRGHVIVSIEDHRSGSLGTAYGFAGVPLAVELAPDEPRARLERLVSEALYTAGLGLAAPSYGPARTPTARVRLGIEAMTCDGKHLRARSTVAVAFSVEDLAGATIVGPERIELAGNGRGCQDAYRESLDRLFDELAARLVEGPAHQAALGLAPEAS